MIESTAGHADVVESSQSARVADLERQVATLQAAVATNRLTGAAVGLLMARHGLTRDESFSLLVAQSQYTNTKLAVLALELVLAAEAGATSRRK